MNIQNQLQKLLQLGFTHHQAGRLQEAEQLYRRIIAIEQEHELANHFLGAIAQSFGHHEAAVKHFRIAIQRNASNAAAYNGLGRSLHRLSKLEDAKGALVVACQLSPKSPNFYNNLGNLLIDLDNLELATEVYEKAIEIDPNLVEAHTNAARAYSMAGNTDKAFQVYQHVLNINPSFHVAHLNIGQLYEEQSEYEKARKHYEQAIAQRPTFLPALFNLAHLHQNTGQHDLAQVNYHKVLQLNPNHVDTLLNLAQFDPKSEKAKEYLERAYECTPKNPIVIRGLGLFHLMRKEYSLAKDWFLKGIPLAPNDIVFYQALAIADLEMKFYDKALLSAQYALSLQPNQTETLFLLSLIHKGQNNREEAHAFAKQAYELAPSRYYLSQLLGVLHSEEGNFDEARRFLSEALSLSPRQMNVQRHIALIQTQVEEDALDTMVKRFRDDTEGSGEQRIHLGFATAKLLDDAGRHAESFEILRQSNELVREGLIFHIELFREAYQNIIDMSLQTSISPLSVSDDDPVPIFIVGMPRSGTTLTEQILASHSQVYPLGESSSLMDSIPDYPNVLSALDEKTLRGIRNAYLALLPKDMTSPFFTDKMPFNFKYIPIIALAFPRARIINLVRDPMDTCFSIYKKFFSNRHRYAYRLDEIGAMYLIYKNMMEVWRGRYLFLDQSYESLVQNQEAQTRALLEFCGLSYEAAALDFHQTKRHVNTASFYQIRQPIYQTSIGAWRPYAKQLKPLQETLLKMKLHPQGSSMALLACNRGVWAAKQGRFEEAVQWYEESIQHDPNFGYARSNFALSLMKLGRLSDAEMQLRKALDFEPKHAIFLYYLGNVLLAQQRFEEAIEAYRQSLSIEPAACDVLFNLAKTHVHIGQLEQADALYQRILQIEPSYSDAVLSRAKIASRQGRIEESIDLFEMVLSYDVDSVQQERRSSWDKSITEEEQRLDSYAWLGNLYRLQSEYGRAEMIFKWMIRLFPKNPLGYNHLGMLYSHTEEDNIAIKQFELGLEKGGMEVDLYTNLGISHKKLGQYEVAKSTFHKALSLDSDCAAAHNALGNLHLIQGDFTSAVAAYQNALHAIPDCYEFYRHLVNVKTYTGEEEEIENIEALYRQDVMTDENRLQLAFSLAKIYEDIGRYKESFVHLAEGNRLKRETIYFSIETDIAENQRFRNFFTSERFQEELGFSDETPIFIVGMPRSGTTLTEQILASHSQVHGSGELRTLPRLFLKARRGGSLDSLDGIQGLQPVEFEAIGRTYVASLRKDKTERRITDKLPANYWLIGFIRMILPRAKVIYCVRDPRDNCLSLLKNYFASKQNYSYTQEEVATYYRLHQTIMTHWFSLFPDWIHTVRYEDMVSNIRVETERLLQFCELPFEESVLDFHRTKRGVVTASSYQVRQPLYSKSVGLWKEYEEELQPLLAALEMD